ncbi:MAG TPA: hypothetical protein PKU97_10270 [Kofleriaceae bacterium]|jgi:hypothetical protein|nr:hypothetical protein [Kofleriaceae bacterium]
MKTTKTAKTMKTTKTLATCLLLLMTTSVALAGKEEREYVKTDVTPAVKAAEAAYKQSCGCALKIVINVKTMNELYQAKYTAEGISNAVAGYCNDDESKKAVCQLKTLEITKGKETGFTFKGGKGTAATNGKTYVNWEQITHELDK